MQNRKFLTLFRTLDAREAAAFHRYLKRLHGHEDIALAVFDYVRRLYPDFRDKYKLDLAYAYKKIFHADITANDYNRTKILNALSDLHLWLREFLLWEKAKTDSFENRVLWLMVLRERGLDAEFSKQAAWLRSAVTGTPRKGVPDYIKGIAAQHFFYYHRTQDIASTDLVALRQCADDLDVYYAVAKLKLACEMVNLKKKRPLEFDLEALPAVIQLAESQSAADHPLLLLYREVYQLVAANEEERYHRISALMVDQVRYIVPEEMGVLLSYLHNYVAEQIRQGKEGFWEKAHQLNKFGVENGIFTLKNLMSAGQFNNIVNIACRVGDFAWAESFIASQSKFLAADIAADTVLLARAVIRFENHDFGEVFRLLELADFKDINDDIRSRAFLLRAYYESRADADRMLDYCMAFEAFLRRHRKSHKEAVAATLNFLRMMKMLIRKKHDRGRIIREIETAKPIYFTAWLLGKAAVYKAEFAARKRTP